MPPLQTQYDDNIAAGYVGAIVNQELCNLISRAVEDSGGIAFGLAVMQGTADKEVTVSDGSDFLGITVRDQSVVASDPDDPDLFEYQENARIMTKGVIWVAANGAVSAGDEVEVQADGTFGASTSGNVSGARWETSAADTELAQLRLG